MSWIDKIFSKSNTKTTSTTRSASSLPATNTSSTATQKKTNHPRPSTAELKQFLPLRHLEDEQIEVLPIQVEEYEVKDTLFTINAQSDDIIYLLDGQVNMQPKSKACYTIQSGSTQAHFPLNNCKLCGATASALTAVKIIQVSAQLNQLWANKTQQDIDCVELKNIELPEALDGNEFFNSFSQAYRQNKLKLPSLPDVALKLKKAMQQDIGVEQAVEIIQIDPPIATKLIQVANSPLYASVKTISNCHDAVTRLGLEATRNLVMGISIKQLFAAQDPQLIKTMQKQWKKSLFISSLSFVLAQSSQNINPEDALLAGLISDIGIIPLLNFAEQYPQHYPDMSDLEQSFSYLRGPVGALVLHTLGFSEELCNIPHQAENWQYDSGAILTLADIVILARLHAHFETGNKAQLPYINSIPAYSKLTDGSLTPDFSLALMQQARHRINAAMSMLS